MTHPYKSDKPQDRLTELCAEMVMPLDRPENEDVAAIIFLDDDEAGGMVLKGWADETAAMAALFAHMQAVFQASGRDLQFIGIPDSPEGL
jgi:hypothetical protein